MDKNVDTVIISPTDDYSNILEDSCIEENKTERRPKGFVEVFELTNDVDLDNISKEELSNAKFLGKFEAKEPKVKKGNLIVYPGREWLISSMFDIDNTYITALSSDRIYWAGLGSGGATETNPFNPINPQNDDTDLNESVMISEGGSNHGDYRESPTEGYYKKLLADVSYEQDDLNDDYYLIAKIVITISSPEANDSIINEAGLFAAKQNTVGYSGNFTLFSHVTFPSIAKSSDKQLYFIWYIYG